MITFTYDGVDFSSLITVHEITGRGTLPSELETVQIPGKAGVYAFGKRRKERVIEVTFSLSSATPADQRSIVNVLNSLLDLDYEAELKFSDEPTMTYFAYMAGEVSWEEDRSYLIGTVSFVCPDPYKYGPENSVAISGASSSIVNIGGTVETKPTFELTTTVDSTFVMVANGEEEYMMVGKPTTVSATAPYKKYEQTLFKTGGSMTGFTAASPGSIDGTITGTMATDSLGFHASSYGTGTGWHGPASKYVLPSAMQDFRLEAGFDFRNKANDNLVGRLEMYLLDDAGNQLGKVAIKDNLGLKAQAWGEIRAGDIDGRYIISEAGLKGFEWNDFKGLFRIERVGNKWSAYIARLSSSGEHSARRYIEWTDRTNSYTNAVASVVIHVGQYGTSPTPTQRVTFIRAYKINPEPPGGGSTPYVAENGSKFVFNHATRELTRDGEPIKDMKDFGAIPFSLRPGNNTISILPSTGVTGTMKWRNAYK